ncbi:MAG: pentapeptide repeat-containing protein [Woeseiaceae bacterium]|nr:pentapeptide repeat-containing protein [Woeseiaceae bacterium]
MTVQELVDRWPAPLTDTMIKEGLEVGTTEQGMLDYRGVVIGWPFFKVSFENADFSHCSLPGDQIGGRATFKGCLFEKSKFTGSIGAELTDCRFIDARFRNMTWGGQLNDCLFENTELRTVRWYDDNIQLNRIVFKNCYFHRCQMMGVRFLDCTFENCRYLGNSFADSYFINCGVTERDFGDSILLDATFD